MDKQIAAQCYSAAETAKALQLKDRYEKDMADQQLSERSKGKSRRRRIKAAAAANKGGGGE